ncbi:hypothetical protein EDD37DRAFT_497778 [Exophiala viscosa]|uniref:uncharacterized protein n=1 Tax=Exophiala viscosa TaxID=2486360 RepID=UPI00219EFC90|nr:hypothetical protein EDD37DRAFT_497778 [Exophiala viscosa]
MVSVTICFVKVDAWRQMFHAGAASANMVFNKIQNHSRYPAAAWWEGVNRGGLTGIVVRLKIHQPKSVPPALRTRGVLWVIAGIIVPYLCRRQPKSSFTWHQRDLVTVCATEACLALSLAENVGSGISAQWTLRRGTRVQIMCLRLRLVHGCDAYRNARHRAPASSHPPDCKIRHLALLRLALWLARRSLLWVGLMAVSKCLVSKPTKERKVQNIRG